MFNAGRTPEAEKLYEIIQNTKGVLTLFTTAKYDTEGNVNINGLETHPTSIDTRQEECTPDKIRYDPCLMALFGSKGAEDLAELATLRPQIICC